MDASTMKYIFLVFCLLFTACHTGRKPTGEKPTVVSPIEAATTTEETQSPVIEKSRTALYLDSLGLINIQSADSSIAVKLLYATPENFTGELLYEDLKDAYLHPDALKSLLRAQQSLKEKHPGYSLIVYDAARPMSVQKKNVECSERHFKKHLCIQSFPWRWTP